MDVLLITQSALFLMGFYCLWLSLKVWREGRGEPFLYRLVGPMLWISVAAVIFYGMSL